MSNTEKETKFDRIYKATIEFMEDNYKRTRANNLEKLEEEPLIILFLLGCANHILNGVKIPVPQDLDDIITKYLNEFNKYMKEEFPNVQFETISELH